MKRYEKRWGRGERESQNKMNYFFILSFFHLISIPFNLINKKEEGQKWISFSPKHFIKKDFGSFCYSD
jgi:hypothetical protein